MKFTRFVTLFACVLAACQADLATGPAPSVETKYEAPGSFPVGNRSIELTDASRGRTLRVEFWYPAAESARSAAEAGQPVLNFMHDATGQTAYEELLAEAPAENGPSKTAHSAYEAPMADVQAKWPTLFFSHCMNCTRFSIFSIAERLASHGFVVVAPDHTGGTLFDSLNGDSASLDSKFLEVRAADIRFVMDEVLDGARLPAGLQGRFDADAVGVFGHSFGGATTGKVLNLDSRPKAGLALAVPMESLLLPGVAMADVKVPVFFLVAQEDNMIFEVGNDFIRDNYAAATVPAWKLELRDAGHMSFTDICGITESYHAGCYYEDRQTRPGEYFDYIPAEIARNVASAYVTAFFSAILRNDEKARAYLTSGRPSEWVEIQSHE